MIENISDSGWTTLFTIIEALSNIAKYAFVRITLYAVRGIGTCRAPIIVPVCTLKTSRHDFMCVPFDVKHTSTTFTAPPFSYATPAPRLSRKPKMRCEKIVKKLRRPIHAPIYHACIRVEHQCGHNTVTNVRSNVQISLEEFEKF